MSETRETRGRITEKQAMALDITQRRVIWLKTDGGEPTDGAWYWIEEDQIGQQRGEIHGPFESAFDAAADAIKLGSILCDCDTRFRKRP